MGPFALWFAFYGKMARRNRLPDARYRYSILAAAFISSHILLFLAPLHWSILVALYVAGALWTAWAMMKPERAGVFHARFASAGEAGKQPLLHAMLGACLAVYPPVYALALIHNIGDLGSFSVRLPSDVYTDGLLWMLYATPLAIGAGLAIRAAAFRPGLRALIFFYSALIVILAWIMVWERLDQFLSAQFADLERDALLFRFAAEESFRAVVKWIFYGGAFLLGVTYLTVSARTSVFFRRSLFLGLPSLLLYANMLFVLGDWNPYLSGLRTRCFEEARHGLYRFTAGIQLARTPAAHHTPFLLDQWAELEYMAGNRAKAAELWSKLSRRYRGFPYYARTVARAENALESLNDPKIDVGPALELELPLIKPASYLNGGWYAVLGATAFLKPDWTDLELKKRLLDISTTVQLRLPPVDNIPEMLPVLRRLEVPVSVCFLTSDRIKEALASRHVAFLSLYGQWVPVSGYDPGRDGFYYHAYRAPGASDWFRNEDADLFTHSAGNAFGGEEKRREAREKRFSLQKFVSRAELEEHILDIGGVGLILGDSAFAGEREREAAFLVEQGDVYYQEHENYEEAAKAYRRAAMLYDDDQVVSRMLYLKRRYRESASDPGDYRNLFRDYPPSWMDGFGPEPARERKITEKLMRGGLGAYLMLNWHSSPAPDTTARWIAAMDTALTLFRTLRAMDPHEPLYLDSLATLTVRKGDLEAGANLYAELMESHPFGNPSAAYRLAWVNLKLGRVGNIPDLLERCEAFSEEAKYLTMQAAVNMGKGRLRRAHALLARSLKLDKTIGETHGLMAEYHRRRGDMAAMEVHLQWLRRSS